MSASHFSFKQFTIQQELCAMKVGTDGVLLGAWADVKSTSQQVNRSTGQQVNRSTGQPMEQRAENGVYSNYPESRQRSSEAQQASWM